MTHRILKGNNRLFNFSPAFKTSIGLMAFVVLLLCSNASGQNISLRGQVDTLPSIEEYTDVYAEGNIAVIGTWKSKGALIVNITNPDAPVLASHYNPVPAQQMLEALVRNNIGYFGSGNGGGVHIVNLSNPANPTLITKITSTTCLTGSTAAINCSYNTIHEMVLDGDFLYITNTVSPNIKVINVSNPAQPVFVRNIAALDSAVHAIHIKNGIMITSGISANGITDIYNVQNIATQAPVRLGSFTTGSRSHSSWLSEDGKYLYNARELSNGDLRVYNIENPAAPLLVKSITAASLGINAICPHNPVVMGNRLYVAWYQAGLQVFDITNPANPVRIGSYDTYPQAFNPADVDMTAEGPWDLYCNTDGGGERMVSGYDGNWAVFPFLGPDKVIIGDLDAGLMILDTRDKNKVADFDADGKTDLSQFRPSTGTWFASESSNGSNTITQQFGLSSDLVAPGDYDGDGRTDIAVFRPSDSTWYMLQSQGGFRAQQFGAVGDVPVPGDYDYDGKTDIAVFRPTNGTWYVNQSTQGLMARQWGSMGDKPLTGDFDADGKTDLGIFRPSNGTWYILPSTSSILIQKQFGISTDIPLVADFDGDFKTDFTIFRPSEGNWYTVRSSTGAFSAQQFGLNDDIPVPADYDGDHKSDIAVFRPSAATWYMIKSATSAFEAKQFGEAGDRPVPAAYSPQ